MQLTYLILGTTRKPIYVFTSSKIKINGTPALKPFPYIRKLTQRKGLQNRRVTVKLLKSIVIIFIYVQSMTLFQFWDPWKNCLYQILFKESLS